MFHAFYQFAHFVNAQHNLKIDNLPALFETAQPTEQFINCAKLLRNLPILSVAMQF